MNKLKEHLNTNWKYNESCIILLFILYFWTFEMNFKNMEIIFYIRKDFSNKNLLKT